MNPGSQGVGPDTGLMAMFREVVRHPVAVTMVSVAALVFGFVSYQRLAIELMPDISYPTITVRTVYEGAAPGEVESQVSRPVEEALATLDGLVTLQSRSRADSSDVVLGFDWGTDMSAATQTIRENLQTTWLPEGAERPLILRYDPSLDPFLRVALSIDAEHVPAPAAGGAQLALLELRELADEEIRRELEAMDGVAAVRVRGGLVREVHVLVREDWLQARELTLDDVRGTLESENVNVAGGSILEGDTEYLVRTLNEYSTAEEIAALRVRRSDGVRVPITDVAEVRETHRDPDVISTLDGMPAVEIEVFKEADANVVDVATRVKAALDGDVAASLDEGVTLAVLDDQAAFIEDAIANLRDTAVLGGLLAIVVLFLFLRDFRATAIVGIAIPMSVLCTFAPLYLGHVSLNLMSLGGLALGVGMLVDNAVVVLESIQRYRDVGFSREDAAVHGVATVAAAVVASTLTTVAVFFPIAFVEGVAGELFGDLSVAVTSSLLASLVVALFVVPTLSALDFAGAIAEPASAGAMRLLVSSAPAMAVLDEVVAPTHSLAASLAWARARWFRWPLVPYVVARWFGQVAWREVVVGGQIASAYAARLLLAVGRPPVRLAARLSMGAADAFNAAYDRFAAAYARSLARSLRSGFGVLVVAGLLFLGSLRAIGWLGGELLPELHQGRFTVVAALPVGTPLQTTAEVMRKVEAIVSADPHVERVYTAVGADRRADVAADEGPHSARLRVQLVPGGDLEDREAATMAALRERIAAEVPRVEVRFERPALFTVERPIEVVVYGFELDALRAAGEDVTDRLRGVEGLADVQTSLERGHPEILVSYDRDLLARFGLDPGTVARRVRDKVQGVEGTTLHSGDQRVDVLVQLAERDRATLGDLRSINVNPALDPPIPLDAVATVTEGIGPSEIRRVGQQRAVVVSANLVGFDLATVSHDIGEELADLRLEPGMAWTLGGQSEEMRRSLASLQFALLLAVFLVYVIMASTFESLAHPFVILFSVPLALVGVVAGLAVVGLPVSVVVLIGMIVLAGVVVNNAIVLVDTVNRLRADGVERVYAIREAAALRLRPILITTITTVLGLVPLALGFGAGAELQQPLAVTVITGLSSATLLTLLVVPIVYDLATRRGGAVPAAAPDPDTSPAGSP